METERIDKTCNLCSEEATGVVKTRSRSLELCNSCVKELFWELAHAQYLFEDED